MAFSEIKLAITPILETTFISDMRLAINSNNTLLKNTVETLINTMQIDVINKYIGVDLPVTKVFSQDVVVANSIVFKAGATPSAATIASLTQAAGVSTLVVDNLTLTKSMNATAAGSKLAMPTLVIGTTDGNLPITYPTTGGIADKGLYVGDSTTPIKSRLYGEVEIPKQAITQSYSNVGGTFTPKQITLIAAGDLSYTYAKLTLAKTDPQFVYVDLIFPSGYSNYGNSIWLVLHEAASNRPAPGQTFTIVLNKIYLYDMTEVDYSLLPAISNSGLSNGINLICGANSDLTNYKRVHINSSVWGTVPVTDVAAIAAAGTGSAYYVRFGNVNNVANAVIAPRDSSFSFTKTEQFADYANYTITNSHNTVIIN